MLYETEEDQRPTEWEMANIQRTLAADPRSKFSRDHNPPFGEDEETNDTLRVLDAWCASRERPIVSGQMVNVVTGAVSSVFWESVKRYKLRRPRETDAQVLYRIRSQSR